MSRWRIDFVQTRHVPAMSWVLLFAGAVALAAAGVWYVHALEALHARQAERALIEADNAATLEAQRQPAVKPPEASLAQDPRWQRATVELNWPWLDTLSIIEQLTRPPVYVLAIKPDKQSGSIRVDAEANSYDDMVDYVRTLQAVDAFTQVQPLRHEQRRDASGPAIVKFALQLRRKDLTP